MDSNRSTGRYAEVVLEVREVGRHVTWQFLRSLLETKHNCQSFTIHELCFVEILDVVAGTEGLGKPSIIAFLLDAISDMKAAGPHGERTTLDGPVTLG